LLNTNDPLEYMTSWCCVVLFYCCLLLSGSV